MHRVRNSVRLAAIVAISIFSLSVSNASSSGDSEDRATDREELLRLNEEFTRSQIVDRSPDVLNRVAMDNFRVLAPGGLIENKAQVIRGLSAWDATDVVLSDTEIVFHDEVAIVMGRMDVEGVMRPVGEWGPLKYMSTWVKSEGEWRILSRSLTPCLEILIQMDRC